MRLTSITPDPEVAHPCGVGVPRLDQCGNSRFRSIYRRFARIVDDKRRHGECRLAAARQPHHNAGVHAGTGLAAERRGRVTKLSGVVIVTGAASGLGRESARHFADCGALVLAVDINEAGLASIASDRIRPARRRPDQSRRMQAGRRRSRRARKNLRAPEFGRDRAPRQRGRDAGGRLGQGVRRQPEGDLPALQARHPAHDREWRRLGGQHVVDSGARDPGGRRRLRRHQGRRAFAHPRDGARPRQGEHPRHRHLPRHDRDAARPRQCASLEPGEPGSRPRRMGIEARLEPHRPADRGRPARGVPDLGGVRASSPARITSSTAACSPRSDLPRN